jgi:ribosomal protein S17
MSESRKKQSLIGTVISSKMEKTVNVRVTRGIPHPTQTQSYLNYRTTFNVSLDENEETTNMEEWKLIYKKMAVKILEDMKQAEIEKDKIKTPTKVKNDDELLSKKSLENTNREKETAKETSKA